MRQQPPPGPLAKQPGHSGAFRSGLADSGRGAPHFHGAAKMSHARAVLKGPVFFFFAKDRP